MEIDAVAELVAELPEGVVVTGAAEVEKYREDFARDGSAGLPAAVVRAETAAQVQQAVRWAAAHRIPVVPRGAGTGLSGGSSAVDGGITISLDRMRAIEIDSACQVAVVEPGALNVEVKRAAAEHGLWYPPDPSSYEICSIGGNLATNAGGLCCVKYGVTTDYVLGMDVVLADGTLVTLGGKQIKDVAGLSLLKLFVGSEGTLGIITRAILRLIPAQRAGATLVSSFPTMTDASRAVVAIRNRVRSSMLELMDNATINAVEDWRSHGLDRSTGALLIAQSDAHGASCEAEIDVIRQCCEEEAATEVFTTTDADEADLFVSARRNAFLALEHRGSVLFEDVGVPVPLLPDLIDGMAVIAEQCGVEIAVVAHAGDGNTHPIVVYDAADPAAVAGARKAFDQVMALAIALGGTITGEHGVGRAKKGALPDQLGADVMALTRRVKDALDPDGILNPGAVL
ncbi:MULTISPECIES: FAD-binding oxidoreductase [unclassified Nocardioides]|uniref:FAD-binding oxidoreductase n=1 Tax=unclassified Nocardioides TaxID=2615069 RepID=UPI000700587B|nr:MULTISPECIES: FAD-linked oxidase C-terminal domain-containing protein [unclassified Nocardioides]KQY61785.1 FAD-linked oxidase [Nocardioides sp. Root140]KQZ70773.1 FAD-linked oxidase [Nocardioides sp. Root151]KRF10880.1 FAD-linked oxidase [Nocardioides sp. Soil796]